MPPFDPDSYRADSREHWDAVSGTWGEVADAMSRWSAPVSATMVDALALQPGDRVLELAAGPGDTGFMAAELVAPIGTLVSSDGSEAMVEVARERARAQGVANVEFRTLELEWIDLPTADVDAVLCRWGVMLVADPAAAAREIRRVLRSGGRAAIAVWDVRERNPWTTIPRAVMLDLGHGEPPDPDAPNQFSLAAPGALDELLSDAGFLDVQVTAIAMTRRFADVADYLSFAFGMMSVVGAAYRELAPADRDAVDARFTAELEPFTDDDGTIVLPGSSLVAVAHA